MAPSSERDHRSTLRHFQKERGIETTPRVPVGEQPFERSSEGRTTGLEHKNMLSLEELNTKADRV